MPLLLKKNIIKGTVGKVRYYFRHASAMFPSSFYFLPVYPAKEKSDEQFGVIFGQKAAERGDSLIFC